MNSTFVVVNHHDARLSAFPVVPFSPGLWSGGRIPCGRSWWETQPPHIMHCSRFELQSVALFFDYSISSIWNSIGLCSTAFNNVEHLSRGSGKDRAEMNSIERVFICLHTNRAVSDLHLRQTFLTRSCMGFLLRWSHGMLRADQIHTQGLKTRVLHEGTVGSWLPLVAWNMMKLLDFHTN